MKEVKLVVIGTTSKSRMQLKERAKAKGKTMKAYINTALEQYDSFVIK